MVVFEIFRGPAVDLVYQKAMISSPSKCVQTSDLMNKLEYRQREKGEDKEVGELQVLFVEGARGCCGARWLAYSL